MRHSPRRSGKKLRASSVSSRNLLRKLGAGELVALANSRYDNEAVLSRESRMKPNFT